MRKLGVFLGEEDLLHMWGRIAQKRGLGSLQGKDDVRVSFDDLASSFGIASSVPAGTSALAGTDMAYANGRIDIMRDARRCVCVCLHVCIGCVHLLMCDRAE